jgi:Tfp pilus assembly protein PilF
VMRPVWIVLGVVSLAFTPGAQSQHEPPAAEDAKFDTVAQRYRQAVRNRPYRGTTFDYWYRHYLDAGKLDWLVAETESAAKSAPDEATAQLILGLVYERKGRDDDAIRAYAAARKLSPDR